MTPRENCTRGNARPISPHTKYISYEYIYPYVCTRKFFFNIHVKNKIKKSAVRSRTSSRLLCMYFVYQVYMVFASLACLGLKNCTPDFETIYLELESDLGSKTVKSVRAG